MSIVRIFATFVFFAGTLPPAVSAQGTRLLRQPTVSGTQAAFLYAGDLWTVDREGGDAKRLTSFQGVEQFPRFSPDGSAVAFTGEYDGNMDVYIVSSAGGEPERLTYHPGADLVRGWSPDGNKVLFSSGRAHAPGGRTQLWTISVEGGAPERLPFPIAYEGSYSSDGKRIAYVPTAPAFDQWSPGGRISAWRHYRGGRATKIWIADLDDLSIERIPWNGSNDLFPMWIHDRIYFLSDRNGTVNLFSYPVGGGETLQHTQYIEHDIKGASANGGTIVYEHNGYLHTFSPSTEAHAQLAIKVRGDLSWTRPHFENVSSRISNIGISPTGARAVVEARGDIYTLPAENGDVRNLTNSPGVADRDPAWSPDGESIAWFSDEGGEYHLKIGGQKGLEKAKSIAIGEPTFFYAPTWSPDSKKILYRDKHRSLWYVEVRSGKITKVGDGYLPIFGAVWSPDSRWIAFPQALENRIRTIKIYSMRNGETHQVTDGLSDAVSPAFDRGGKYLYFEASTDYGRKTGGLDMSSYDGDLTRGIYLIVLDAGDPSPFLPKSDEETDGEDKEKKDEEKKDEEKADVVVRIDFEDIGQRILAVDVPARSYSLIQAGAENTFFYGESVEHQQGLTLKRYDLEDEKAETVIEGVNGYQVSADGKKLLYRARGTLGIVDASASSKSGDGALPTSDMHAKVDPRAEWAQIYLEGWRINRDFFYDENMHGADWPAVYEKYLPLLEHVGHRSDLTYLLSLMIGELVSGHSRTGGGDYPATETVPVGLLGADFTVEDGRYRIARIYTGENWNPGLRAPLSGPGLDVSEGDFLLAVNGVEVSAAKNLYSYFEGTSGKQTVLSVSEFSNGRRSRSLIVVPVPNENALRSRAWVEDNRRKVDEMSEGRLAYVYLPNTGAAGFEYFNRYYFAQMHKQGAVIDERFNGGGKVADYMVDAMGRTLLSYWAPREGSPFRTPFAALYGPKVMIINEFAGSGGDFLPFSFRKRGLGPLIGTRTWGGLIGVGGYPPLIDGGFITAPHFAIYSVDGEWIIENVGVPPDIEVEQMPAEVAAGHDPQLERAVQEALKLLETDLQKWTPRPAPIDRTDLN